MMLELSTIDSHSENIRYIAAMQNRTKRCKDPQTKSKNPKIAPEPQEKKITYLS